MPFPGMLWSLVIFASFWGYGEALRHVGLSTARALPIIPKDQAPRVPPRTLLQEFICQPGHQFWDDTISLVDSRKFPTLPGSKNLTDYYLLALAIKNSGKLVTFDQRIDPGLLQGGISSYHVIKDDSGL
jgi:hypothetical protein